MIRELLISLLRAEIEDYNQCDGLGDNMIASAYLLAIQRNPEDCLLLWEAKAANFSTSLGLRDVILIGAGMAAYRRVSEAEVGAGLRPFED